MNFNQYSPLLRLSLLTGSCLLSVSAWAEDASNTCFIPADKAIQYQPGDLDPQLPITIQADSAEGTLDQNLEYYGNVSFTQGIRQLSADQIILDQTAQTMRAVGNLNYEDHVIAVKADSLSGDMRNNHLNMNNTQYQLQAQPGRGEAELIDGSSADVITLQDASFTTCPNGDNSWQLNAGEITLDMQKEWGTVTNAVVKVANIPALYIPYMTFPLTDKRKSGLLYPTVQVDSNNGFDYKQPYYWNIAPHMDATIAPRWLTKRGLQLQGEFRHLTKEQFNQFNVEYLADDAELKGSDTDRYLGYWQHKGVWKEHWFTHVDYTTVSDDNYFNDLGSEITAETDSRIKRNAELVYRSRHWDAGIQLTDFEVFGNYTDPYQQYPRFSFQYRDDNVLSLSQDIDFELNGEYVHFAHSNADRPDADRFHLEPKLFYHRYLPAGSFEAETKLYQSFYVQHKAADLTQHRSRSIPMVRLAGQLNLERQTTLFQHSMLQTLEPQLQYLYVPYEDQRDIGLYDTNSIQDDFHGLFRARRFTGLDRIADANQLTLGVTSRLLDTNHREHAKFSLGQILYFDNNKLAQEQQNNVLDDKRSALVMSLDMAKDEWSFHAQVQQDSDLKEMQQSEMLIDYAPAENKLVQLSYHYNQNALNLIQPDSSQNGRISQLGLVTSWPIKDNLQFIGSYYRDLHLNRSIDALAGVQYETCCWAVRLMYQRNLNTSFPDEQNGSSRDEYDSGIMLNFVLKGLGGQSRSTQQQMIEKSVFGYRKHYYLNN